MHDRLDTTDGSDSVVDGKRFLVFASIEADPNASSVGWLQARLADLLAELRHGKTLSVYEPSIGKQASIGSIEELRAWADRNFPIARFGTAE
jgi:hypothetical protein